jgi:2-polyprenyl-6-methoxyphenol hydroxylase-like FAD-dependent oxidoreductase
LDASPNERNQGGTLDLHPKQGQLALREAGLWDAFIKHARLESDVMKVVKPDGEVLWVGNGKDAKIVSEEEKFNHRPEIDREKLKEILIGALREENVKWGRKLKKVVEVREGKFDLHFADGEVERGFDLVVGADGAWSKVRALLTDVKPYYSSISSIEVWTMHVDEAHPWISEIVGAGSMFSFGEGWAI